MAVKERRAGVVGGELDFGLALGINKDDVLDDAAAGPRRRSAAAVEGFSEAVQLEAVSVEMQRVVVSALINELQSVTLALDERGDARLGIRSAVDRPALHGAMSAELRFKHERDND